MEPRVLVTGGAGFIGSHLVDACLERGCSVTVIDDLSVGRLSNLESHKKNSRLRFVKASIAEYETIEPLFKGIDWVFHLAARADIVPSIQVPRLYHKANVEGTVSVLEAAKLHKVKRFIYAASSSCYGISDQYPTSELAPLLPKYPYALTKMIAEQYVLHWHQVYQLPALSLRFFNVYGPRARTSGTYGAVFGVFLAQKCHGKPLTVVGDGSQTRDFTFVSDAVGALIKAAESEISGEIFNVGSGGTYSISSLVKLLGGEITYIPKRPGEPDCTFADISKIQKVLGWSPSISFGEGVGILLGSLDEWKNAPIWNPDSIAAATKEWFQYLG